MVAVVRCFISYFQDVGIDPLALPLFLYLPADASENGQYKGAACS